jgi:hypothetical protein
MPYPLAHPVAVLPLRRYCPQRLNFPALVAGSLSPDLGYAFGDMRFAQYSHGFAGSLAFCVPAGLGLVAAFYFLKRPLVRILPAHYKERFLPQSQPGGACSLVLIVISLLVGAWSHLLLDGVTHEDSWLVEHVAWLQCSLPLVGGQRVSVYALLYAGCTFGGVLWLALDYLSGPKEALGRQGVRAVLTKWIWSLALAAGTLVMAEASREPWHVVGVVPAAGIVALLVGGFVVGTIKRFQDPAPPVKTSRPTLRDRPVLEEKVRDL